MRFDRKRYFDTIRQSLPANKMLTQGQVDGMNLLLAEGERRNLPLEWIAYVLATAWFETAYTMQPIKEMGSQAYLKSQKYYPYYGRGYVQLTWKYNYQVMGNWLGVDLVNNPDKALDPTIAVQVIYEGMVRGMFTAKKLSDYMDGVTEADEREYQEYLKSRAIINGRDHDSTIAKFALIFQHALQASQTIFLPDPKLAADADPNATPPESPIIIGPAPQVVGFNGNIDMGALWSIAATALISIVGIFGSLNIYFQGLILVFVLTLLGILSVKMLFPRKQKLGMLM